MTNDVATAITSSLSPINLWTEVSHILPVVLPLIIFSFGFYILRKVLKTSRTGKTRI